MVSSPEISSCLADEIAGIVMMANTANSLKAVFFMMVFWVDSLG